MQLKRILANTWLQLFLGLVAGVMAVIFFAFLGILLYIKYVGLTSLDSNGDQALVASTITAVFLLLLFGFHS